MKSFTPQTVVAVSAFFLATNVFAAEDEMVGCYSSQGPMVDGDVYTYQSIGHCREVCTKQGMPVLGLTKGSDCYCSEKIPSVSSQTSKDDCDSPCDGYPQNICGGDNAFSVYLTGTKELDDIEVEGGKSPSSSDSDSPTTTNAGGETVVVTASESPSEGEAEDDGGPNTAAIAAGVVVGVVALIAIIGGVWFILRRRRKAMEYNEDRTAAIPGFVGGKPNSSSSMSDSRLDPSMMAHRRQSDGSIADNQDFSRRILQVTNPDGR
ncbi:hypothetical protein FQN54_000522 [Arachnomyces sp. PD_36]|nr:hypothetical protein FQN54_000522 [Arachnomyces sp. PD_36]